MTGSRMTRVRTIASVLFLAFGARCAAQTQSSSPPMKRLLVLGEEKGYRHEAVSHAMATIERLGRESGLWVTTIRTDTEVLTKQKLEYNAKNLNDFDAVLFYTGGELEMKPEQKAALLSFVHDDGKGFIGVHSATITFTSWPEYGEMIGGYFDEHPWVTFDAPIIVEDPNFPGMQQWPKSFVLKDEIYQMKDYSRDKVRVLMRLDASRLDLNNPHVHRKDRDFAVTWAKTYGKGRVFYSTLGHVEQNWDDPRFQKMYLEAIKWAMGLVDADVTPRPLPAQSGSAGNERNNIHFKALATVSDSQKSLTRSAKDCAPDAVSNGGESLCGDCSSHCY
jgi:type 1 glutamine amidotransferase